MVYNRLTAKRAHYLNLRYTLRLQFGTQHTQSIRRSFGAPRDVEIVIVDRIKVFSWYWSVPRYQIPSKTGPSAVVTGSVIYVLTLKGRHWKTWNICTRIPTKKITSQSQVSSFVDSGMELIKLYMGIWLLKSISETRNRNSNGRNCYKRAFDKKSCF